ncbi:MAG: amidase family protein, partial [Bacteroidota bacterium]
PTVGLLSRSGIIPISFTSDTPGPMTRTVTDAAIALGTMVGVDEADSKTTASEGNYSTDYTSFLDAESLKGKRLGLWTGPMGRRFRVDTLMHQTVRKLEELGAEVVEVNRMAKENVGRASYQVLLYEFKDGLNTYFATLGDDAPVKDLDELIEKTFSDPVEMKYFDHNELLEAQKKGSLEDKEYQEAVKKMLEVSQKGIDNVLDTYDLDAIIAPTGAPAWKTDHTNGDNFSVSASSPAARAGYPAITVPMGYIDGLPVGITFFGTAWDEGNLIGMAYAFEQATTVRKVPTFRNYEF